MSERGLFSVVVLTYNQEDLIVDCLQSILSQTYPKIELIVSDDASQDTTLRRVEHWLEKANHRFQRVGILSSSVNKGIPSNYNRLVETYCRFLP